MCRDAERESEEKLKNGSQGPPCSTDHSTSCCSLEGLDQLLDFLLVHGAWHRIVIPASFRGWGGTALQVAYVHEVAATVASNHSLIPMQGHSCLGAHAGCPNTSASSCWPLTVGSPSDSRPALKGRLQSSRQSEQQQRVVISFRHDTCNSGSLPCAAALQGTTTAKASNLAGGPAAAHLVVPLNAQRRGGHGQLAIRLVVCMGG